MIKKKKVTLAGLIGIAFLFHPMQEQTKVISALCEHEKILSIM